MNPTDPLSLIPDATATPDTVMAGAVTPGAETPAPPPVTGARRGPTIDPLTARAQAASDAVAASASGYMPTNGYRPPNMSQPKTYMNGGLPAAPFGGQIDAGTEAKKASTQLGAREGGTSGPYKQKPQPPVAPPPAPKQAAPTPAKPVAPAPYVERLNQYGFPMSLGSTFGR